MALNKNARHEKEQENTHFRIQKSALFPFIQITRMTYFLLSDRSMLIPHFMVLKGPFRFLPELK